MMHALRNTPLQMGAYQRLVPLCRSRTARPQQLQQGENLQTQQRRPRQQQSQRQRLQRRSLLLQPLRPLLLQLLQQRLQQSLLPRCLLAPGRHAGNNA